jgi:hypothetical protein
VVVRCTGKLLNLLGQQRTSLVDAPSSDDDSYANLLWIDRRKCLLIMHAGTLFSLLVADIRVSDLRPFERHDVDDLNRHLRRSLHTKNGDYRIPLELVHERLHWR